MDIIKIVLSVWQLCSTLVISKKIKSHSNAFSISLLAKILDIGSAMCPTGLYRGKVHHLLYISTFFMLKSWKNAKKVTNLVQNLAKNGFLSLHQNAGWNIQQPLLVQLSINFKLSFWKKEIKSCVFQNNLLKSWLTTAQAVVHLPPVQKFHPSQCLSCISHRQGMA